jgi:hypothetical protein
VDELCAGIYNDVPVIIGYMEICNDDIELIDFGKITDLCFFELERVCGKHFRFQRTDGGPHCFLFRGAHVLQSCEVLDECFALFFQYIHNYFNRMVYTPLLLYSVYRLLNFFVDTSR